MDIYAGPRYDESGTIYDAQPQEEFTLSAGGALNEQLRFACFSAIVDNPTPQWVHIVNTNHYVPPGVAGFVIRLPGVGRAQAEWAAPPGVTQPPGPANAVALLVFVLAQLPPGGATTSVGIVSTLPNLTVTGPSDLQGGVTVEGAARFDGSPWYDLTHPVFGCIGNGATDCYTPPSGLGLPGWAAAIVANTAIGFVPPGTFRTSRPIHVSGAFGANCWIMGSGQWASTFTVLVGDYANFTNDFVFGGPGPSWIGGNIKLTDFRIDGQARNNGGAAGGPGGISFGASALAERVHLDDLNALPWSFRSGGAGGKLIDCRSSRGVQANSSDNISGGFGVTNIWVIRHQWDANLAGNSVYDFVPASKLYVIDCVNLSILSIIPEACNDVLIDGLIATGGGGIMVQSDAGYNFPAGTTNCRGVTITNCILVGANVGIPVAGVFTTFGGAIIINFSKGGAATVLGYGIVVDHNTVIEAPLCSIIWVNDDPTCNAGGCSCLDNKSIDCNVTNVQIATSLFLLFTVDGGVGFFFAHGGVGTQIARNIAIDTRGAPRMRHGFQLGQSNGGAGTVAGSGLLFGLDNVTTGAVSTTVLVPGTLVTPPSVRNVQIFTGVAGNFTPDPTKGEIIDVSMIGNVTVQLPLAFLVGQRMLLRFRQDAVGGRTVTWVAGLHVVWSDAGNAANFTAMVEVYADPLFADWQQTAPQRAWAA